MGRVPPPVDAGVLTLMEVSDAYLARALEIQMEIHAAETQGTIPRGSAAYKLRTGELRDFIELAKGAVDLGSRRVTVAKMSMLDD